MIWYVSYWTLGNICFEWYDYHILFSASTIEEILGDISTLDPVDGWTTTSSFNSGGLHFWCCCSVVYRCNPICMRRSVTRFFFTRRNTIQCAKAHRGYHGPSAVVRNCVWLDSLIHSSPLIGPCHVMMLSLLINSRRCILRLPSAYYLLAESRVNECWN